MTLRFFAVRIAAVSTGDGCNLRDLDGRLTRDQNFPPIYPSPLSFPYFLSQQNLNVLLKLLS